MNARAVFVGADGRARAPWRILLFLALWICCAVVVMIALGGLLRDLGRAMGAFGLAESVGMTISLLAAHAIMLRLIDRRGWDYAWLDRAAAAPRRLGIAFGVGGAPIATASLLLLAVGWLEIRSMPDGSSSAAALAISVSLLPAAFYEELLSRGYVFAALAEWLGRTAAIAVTSIAFGVLHVWNPGWTVGSISSVILAGVFLAAVLLVTRSLYAAWVAHFAWNWVMAVPLHLPVSGLTLATPDYRIVDAGPDWATGGRWGPEGGAFAAAAMILALSVLYLVGSRRPAFGVRPGNGERDPGAERGEPHSDVEPPDTK